MSQPEEDDLFDIRVVQPISYQDSRAIIDLSSSREAESKESLLSAGILSEPQLIGTSAARAAATRATSHSIISSLWDPDTPVPWLVPSSLPLPTSARSASAHLLSAHSSSSASSLASSSVSSSLPLPLAQPFSFILSASSSCPISSSSMSSTVPISLLDDAPESKSSVLHPPITMNRRSSSGASSHPPAYPSRSVSPRSARSTSASSSSSRPREAELIDLVDDTSPPSRNGTSPEVATSAPPPRRRVRVTASAHSQTKRQRTSDSSSSFPSTAPPSGVEAPVLPLPVRALASPAPALFLTAEDLEVEPRPRTLDGLFRALLPTEPDPPPPPSFPRTYHSSHRGHRTRASHRDRSQRAHARQLVHATPFYRPNPADAFPYAHLAAIRHQFHHGSDALDVDNMTYEELLRLGERIGHVKSRGISAESISALPTHKFRGSAGGSDSAASASCPICLVNFELGETLTTLPCFHIYHSECLTPWLRSNAVCPVCKTAVQI